MVAGSVWSMEYPKGIYYVIWYFEHTGSMWWWLEELFKSCHRRAQNGWIDGWMVVSGGN